MDLSPVKRVPNGYSLPDPIVILLARNEKIRLPYFFEYHRGVGVRTFLVVDDHSTDGSLEWLLAQKDCYIYRPRNTFANSAEGIDWVNDVLRSHCEGKWVIKADADELLVYPYMEQVSLTKLCSLMERDGFDALELFMLDMYSKGALKDAVYEEGNPFLSVCQYFDKSYFFHSGSKSGVSRQKAVLGGPRQRVFYPEYSDNRAPFRFRNKLTEKLGQFIEATGVRLDSVPHRPPCLSKVGPIHWRSAYSFSSSHSVDGELVYAPGNGVFLHFKFFSDFYQKVMSEVARKQHYKGAIEYRRYKSVLQKNPTLKFFCDESCFYEGSQSLVQQGLISAWSSLDELIKASSL